MKFIFVLLMALPFSSAFAQSVSTETLEGRLAYVQQKGQLIEDQNLLVAGRGVSNDAGESLALICSQSRDEKCQSLQWVYFAPDQKIYSVGQPIHLKVASELGSKEVKQAIKERAKEYKLALREQKLRQRIYGGDTVAYLAHGGALALVLVLPISPVVGMGAVLVGGIIYATSTGEYGAFLLSTKGTENHASSDRDGWNWSASPKNISAKKFKKVFEMITTPLQSEGMYVEID